LLIAAVGVVGDFGVVSGVRWVVAAVGVVGYVGVNWVVTVVGFAEVSGC